MLKILRKLDVLGTQGLSSLKKRNEKVFNIFKVLLQLKEWKPRLTSQTYIFKSKAGKPPPLFKLNFVNEQFCSIN